MTFGARKYLRVNFERGIDVNMISIDGTWRRACKMIDVSETGAGLLVQDTIEGLQLKEFFLVLSANGKVFRRCELIRVNCDQLGVQFLKGTTQRKSKGRS
jgi:hypothetical protein